MILIQVGLIDDLTPTPRELLGEHGPTGKWKMTIRRAQLIEAVDECADPSCAGHDSPEAAQAARAAWLAAKT